MSIVFTGLGHHSPKLPDRLLTILLGAMPQAGPVIAQNVRSGELSVTVAFESTCPTEDAARMKRRLDSALAQAGVQDPPGVLDVHVVAVDVAEEGFGEATSALQAV